MLEADLDCAFCDEKCDMLHGFWFPGLPMFEDTKGRQWIKCPQCEKIGHVECWVLFCTRHITVKAFVENILTDFECAFHDG